MKSVVFASLIASALAVPTELAPRTDVSSLCPAGLYSVPQCCATDILGVARLDCKAPKQTPRNADEFKNICAKGGQQAACCVVPVAGQSLFCMTPVGI
ncbi:hydrophobin-like protein [Beauveria bassiana ARSEF 2860]|uniref:Class II hydrophobin A n=1 Tax=Beauveria bassiana (strain ARSEF 2860) TaxID=655819 RepID=HYD2A_BEAB2|nr:hydrophobin-like protein [Beauveria bassiana ARSEF 2860]EJP68175.1 hydrophobin-like protein [Beauveria bassiana ARSEF 2860]